MQTRYTVDFQEIRRLGKGGFGRVYECKHKLDESTYAVKKIPFPDQEHAEYLREVKILAALQHPSVIRYYQCWIELGVSDVGSSSDEDEMMSEATHTLFVAMELCTSTLHARLEAKIEKVPVFRYLKELLEGLQFIHEKGVIHGDLSRDNIFLDDHDHIKIGDFGLARNTGDDSIPIGDGLGNMMYRAPELSIDPRLISTKSDMFSLGLVLFELSCPLATGYERARQCEIPEETVDETSREIICQLLKKDPQQRPSAAQLLHRYFP
ncbi:eIF-2-alpha kinase GCN2 [Nicotiana tabacum]|uniref:EIF-2-alpha kinase GCN2 n=2 Tax=Nicotiana tabacum TaxID=4097 RepID=A0A1S4DMY1_TOBAC|nr:PREDICTED: eIF-2-alpha kinase GCN2-like [Nicotiana tabacum]XP_016514779.1 PREDICTED: eIF-2-alpha kinase GCN2-like [Nicotiana tabacum]XP_016514780.1 PREDICTED: eIF-2-alpha kinase GCN2-like [Nicotiana tabacum]XP_016514781.1 PREDICTED: eIF-2-alpha kinase GCN2-like [Nicotiana tabacum]